MQTGTCALFNVLLSVARLAVAAAPILRTSLPLMRAGRDPVRARGTLLKCICLAPRRKIYLGSQAALHQ